MDLHHAGAVAVTDYEWKTRCRRLDILEERAEPLGLWVSRLETLLFFPACLVVQAASYVLHPGASSIRGGLR